ncbi:NADP/FAD dependent oxidoreductase [Lineolata rhizophorae]|uniref:NADPH--cytochrome P450 reductase n=1 Tax=Lineolata rhizophorae TaxID=578093 RepID=A0A6A6NL25_9PEZI|nr:NADP/FAD dependent oxidoreductase [Lineolata rhizophorae]
MHLTHIGVPLFDRIAPSSYADAVAIGAAVLASAAYLLREYTWNKPDPFYHLWFERPQENSSAANARRNETRNIAQRLDELGKDVVIFWGSQSGTAEGFAYRLARELHQRFHLEAMAADLSDFDPETIALIPDAKIAIFILSTYGEGDPSDNATGFWEWLTKLHDRSLDSLRYAAFGLGNSEYRHYNRVVDVVDEALELCGAKRLKPPGKANDAKGSTQEDFLSWKDELFAFFRSDLGFQEHEVKYEPTLSVVEDDSLQPADLHIGEPVHSADKSAKATPTSSIGALKIKNSRELFTASSRNCVHLELDLAGHPQITYKTGDHLAIWPMNPDDDVERLIRTLGLDRHRGVPICIKGLDQGTKVRVPTPTTVEVLFRYYVEICGPVSRDTVRGLVQFAPTPSARTFLLDLSRDKNTFTEFLRRTHVNLGRLLELATGADVNTVWSIPLSYIIETLPHTQPRYYSISSSSILSPRAPTITALVSNTALPDESTASIPGLTTNYLLALSHSLADSDSPAHPQGLSYNLPGPSDALAGGKVFAHIRRSKFKLPMQSSCPIIMVAAGTGLAPFRAFIEERVRLQSIGRPLGEMILFFGCRRPDEDYIYREELEQMEKGLQGKLRIVTAFSRVHGENKVYVQDRVFEHGRDICRMVGEGANLYICGRASMAREVRKRVEEVMGTDNGWDEEEVKEWTESMKRKNKWQEDVWG